MQKFQVCSGRTGGWGVRKGAGIRWGPEALAVDSGAVMDPCHRDLGLLWSELMSQGPWFPLEGSEWGGMCGFPYPGPSCSVDGADMVAGQEPSVKAKVGKGEN